MLVQFSRPLMRSTVVPDFPTTFPLTQNPISQGGIWLGGGTDGLDWHNQRTTTGKCYGDSFSHDGGVSDYDDNLAILKTSYRTFANNQFAEAITYRAPAYTPGTNHETELLLRFAITANSATGYEMLWSHDGWLVIVRWNGPLGNFTQLASTGAPIAGDAVDGDVIKFTVVGITLKGYKNGVEILSVDDATYASGQPGHGSWARTGATLANLGWKQWNAGDLP